MICAKNYKTVTKFVKVMPRILWPLFFPGHGVYGDKCLRRPAIHGCGKKFAHIQESVGEERPGHATNNQACTSLLIDRINA